MAFVKAALYISFTKVNVLGSTLISASSSTVYDATTLYSKVACYTVEQLTKID